MPTAFGDDLDTSAILKNYHSQHRAMTEGRTDVLDEPLADQFTATHITGCEQPKAEWLAQISSGISPTTGSRRKMSRSPSTATQLSSSARPR